MTKRNDDQALIREKEFHNRRYESGSERRKSTSKYYALKKDFDHMFLEVIRKHTPEKKILEIGCGSNINTPHWMDIASESHAVDISDVAISQAEQVLGDEKEKVQLSVMNAEAMSYDDNYFDVICGKGIIHHLDVETAWNEVSRILKPEGVGVFVEPLGHNPLINTYRRWTPQMRSEDEHPLRMNDIKSAYDFFDVVDVDYQHITTILSVFLPGKAVRETTFSLFDAMDKGLMRILPFIKKYCWMVFICLRNPKPLLR